MNYSLLIFLFTLVTDQVFKLYALHYTDITAFWFIKWHPTYNYGVTLSYLSDIPASILALISIALLLLTFKLPMSKMTRALLLSGGLSNLLDRVIHGYVIDYIQFYIGPYHWPAIINLADIYLCIAAYLWLFDNSYRNTGILTSRTLQSD